MLWISLIVLFFSIFFFLYVYLRQSSRRSIPQIDTFTLSIFYLPIFLVKGLVPAILSARAHYGPTFCVDVWGIKQRIFFLTDPHGRNAILKNAHFRLPAAQVAQVFGMSNKMIEMFTDYEYIHEFGSIFQGLELKNMTNKHRINLQKTIVECLDHGQVWSEMGLYELCSMLVYESITTTLFGSNVDARSIVNELKTLDRDVHLLAYPSFFRWFKVDLIRSKKKIVQRLSSIPSDDLSNIFVNKINELASLLTKDDAGNMNTAILWASYGNVIPAIFWSYFYLRRYPKVLDNVLQEVERNDLISSTPQLDSVIEETMRLMANALVVRECMQDTEIKIVGTDQALLLAENDLIVLFPFASQIDEEYFPRPHEFIYDRFLVGSANEVSPAARRVHAPFGEGKFICPGRHLGRNIVKLTIMALLKQFDFEFFDDYQSMKIPAMLKARYGFGIPPPAKDLRIRYRIKDNSSNTEVPSNESHFPE